MARADRIGWIALLSYRRDHEGQNGRQLRGGAATFWKSLAAKKPGRRVTLHSFRRNFRDALRLHGIDANLAKEVGGWSRGGDTHDSYDGGARAVVLRPIVDAVTYELYLGHLHLTVAANIL